MGKTDKNTISRKILFDLFDFTSFFGLNFLNFLACFAASAQWADSGLKVQFPLKNLGFFKFVKISHEFIIWEARILQLEKWQFLVQIILALCIRPPPPFCPPHDELKCGKKYILA